MSDSLPPMLLITTHYFVAACTLQKGVVIDSAPIIRYMRGWTREKVETYCRKKGWECKEI